MNQRRSVDDARSRRRLRWGAWIVLILSPVVAGPASAETWAEKLGYPAGKKVLLLHADDIGMCYEANQAAKSYLEKRHMQSAAVMVPCPWFNEFADWAAKNSRFDVGLHLTLTSEWKFYRWGPVAGREAVPSLVDSEGYLHRRTADAARSGTPADVEKELRAQIERALSRGLRPGHLDTHMGVLYTRPDFTAVYLKLAEEYRIPAMVIEMSPERVRRFRAQGYPVGEEMQRLNREYKLPKLDDFRSVPGGGSYEEVREKLFELVRSLEPGITEVICHPSVETEGLKKITNSWRQRSWEARLFGDPAVLAFFEKEGVLFTDWKEMMRRFEAKVSD